MEWIKLRCDEFPEAVKKSNGVCVIPIGCVESHGIHLPLGCDTIKAKDFALRAAEQEEVVVFPEMYFGEKSGAGEFPGTIIFPTQLIWQILEQSCNEIARNGFKKIILLDSHGGNKPMLQAFTRNILQKKPDYLVFHYYQSLPKIATIVEKKDNFPYLTDEDMAILNDFVAKNKRDGHGGFVETSMIYDIYPDLVRLDLIDARCGTSTGLFEGFTKRGIYSGLSWMANYPDSYSCDVHHGINERIARAIADETIAATREAFKYIKEETVSTDYYYNTWFPKQK
jgi:creatinine amidohydrolase